MDLEKKYIKKEQKFSIDLIDDILKYQKITYGEFIRRLDFEINNIKHKLINQGWEINEIIVSNIFILSYNVDDECKLEVLFNISRLETDDEVKKRIKRSEAAKLGVQKRKERIEKEEKKLLEKLKKKYDNTRKYKK